jgi:diguanylate cyclase (GGDEF)-like protein/PAS domain S-box-containing protein
MLRFLFYHVPVGIAFISLDGHILQVNPELCRFLAYPEDQLRALTYREITHPDALLATTTLYTKMAAGELDTARMESIFVRSDGVPSWGLLSVALVRDSANKPAHFMSMVSDISLRKRALADLETTRDRYGAILDNLEDAVLVCDPRLNLLHINQTCRRLLGWQSEDLADSALYTYVHPDDWPAVQESYVVLVAESGEPAHINCRIRRKDGTWFWLDTYIRATRGPAGELSDILLVGRPAPKQEFLTGRLSSLLDQPALNLDSKDPLTGLRSRKACDDLLAIRLASPRSSAFPIGCLLVDIDHFATTNTAYGRTIGDEILKRVAATLNDSCRNDDFVARYGPDEFLVVLPGTNAAGTITLGEKLVRNVRETDWSDLQLKVPITVSIGATCVQYGTGVTLRDLTAVLHTQVQQAQNMGRNRMVMNARRSPADEN